jgi:hypothetical protein
MLIITAEHSVCSESSDGNSGAREEGGERRAWSVYVWWGEHGREVLGFRFAESEHVGDAEAESEQ